MTTVEIGLGLNSMIYYYIMFVVIMSLSISVAFFDTHNSVRGTKTDLGFAIFHMLLSLVGSFILMNMHVM
jgi:hypothetical protein